ncbi:MAG: LytTR family DNA-binding domain-containing protein [Anaerostipes sp.]|jgi:DNA-binding LytR/AlgR family response regulator|nr:LytTR family DNA-binding domain-containing protein [Anaerostipes sp.]
MKIKIEVDENLIEEEILIRCKSFDNQIQKIQEALTEATKKENQFVFYKGETEYYLTLDEILFFETEKQKIMAHTGDEIYETKYKLYELEELLPKYFLRVSKSTILNVTTVRSIQRNITSTSLVTLKNTYKQVFVSRRYYKELKEKLIEMRNLL